MLDVSCLLVGMRSSLFVVCCLLFVACCLLVCLLLILVCLRSVRCSLSAGCFFVVLLFVMRNVLCVVCYV